MQLEKIDRVLLINQYKILKKLDSESGVNYDELIEILQYGYEIFYSIVDEWIGEGMSKEKGKFVLDILGIYRMVEDYKKQNPQDEEILNHRWGYFKGFDGNEESEYFAFTLFLIETQKKFLEQLPYKTRNDNFNSHFPVVDKYQKMVSAWKSLGRGFRLSKEQILEILDS